MAQFWNSKVMLAKIEATYGTDPVPTGALNAMLATNVRLSPMEGQDKSRDLELPYMGGQETIPSELHRKLTFDVELTPSGTPGVAPPWGVFMRGCGCAETIVASTSVTYNPISSGFDSICLYQWVDGTLFKFHGTRGTGTIKATAQDIPKASFEFTGLYSPATAMVQVTPDLAAQLARKPTLANSAVSAFKIDGSDFVTRSFALNMGNTVSTRFLIGSESVIIEGRDETVEATVEAVALGDFDPWALAVSQTPVELELRHGNTAGLISTLSVQAAQVQRTQSLENSQNRVEWPLRLKPLPVSGNDQWTLTLT